MTDEPKKWIRCMGGGRCGHAAGTCTASPEYQAQVGRKPTVVEDGEPTLVALRLQAQAKGYDAISQAIAAAPMVER